MKISEYNSLCRCSHVDTVVYLSIKTLGDMGRIGVLRRFCKAPANDLNAVTTKGAQKDMSLTLNTQLGECLTI